MCAVGRHHPPNMVLSTLGIRSVLRGRVRVEQDIRAAIADGRMVGGEQLATEAALSSTWSVSRSTVRSALAQLVVDGVLGRRGRRHVVVAPASTAAPPARSRLLARTILIIGHGPTVPPAYQVSAGWQGQVRLVVSGRLQAAGFHLLQMGDPAAWRQALATVALEPPAGIVVLVDDGLDDATMAAVECARIAGIPVLVYAASDGVPGIANLDRVISDHASGCAQLCRWMFARGRRHLLRIWTVRDPAHYPAWLLDRERGFALAHGAAGLTPPPPCEMLPLSGLDGHRRGFAAAVYHCMGWLTVALRGPQPIDGILCTSDGEAFAISAALRALGRVPGQDILIAGYDAYWTDPIERTWEPHPMQVTVDRCLPQSGARLAELVQATELRTGPRSGPWVELIEPRLIEVV